MDQHEQHHKGNPSEQGLNQGCDRIQKKLTCVYLQSTSIIIHGGNF